MLSNPALVSDQDCHDFMFQRGKGWVCEIGSDIVGFAIADLVEHNIWALFIHPDYENKGIGRSLHNTMLDWYFAQNQESLYGLEQRQAQGLKLFITYLAGQKRGFTGMKQNSK